MVQFRGPPGLAYIAPVEAMLLLKQNGLLASLESAATGTGMGVVSAFAYLRSPEPGQIKPVPWPRVEVD
jgi:hypothetical protein